MPAINNRSYRAFLFFRAVVVLCLVMVYDGAKVDAQIGMYNSRYTHIYGKQIKTQQNCWKSSDKL